ncbi:MAG: protein kinase [Myxococcales bacterium]|nr:protein kinase [Myxococcales bacterium]
MSLKEDSVAEKAETLSAKDTATAANNVASSSHTSPAASTGDLSSENASNELISPEMSPPTSTPKAASIKDSINLSSTDPRQNTETALSSHGISELKEREDESGSLSNDPGFQMIDRDFRDSSISIQSLSGIRPPSDDSIFHRIQRFEDASEVDLPIEGYRRPQSTGIGSVLDNKYRITHKIAEGGMGIVYGASHTKLGKQVAIKVIAPGTLSNEESRRRFVREAKASTLLSSPHTVRVYDYNVSQWGEPYLVMEFVSGTNLNQLLKSHTEPMDPERAVHITKQIAQSLMEAHANGLIHRDLKPSNVMLMHLKGHDDFVKIFDFGVVKFADAPEESDLTRQGVVLGTPRYMAPEQITSPSTVSFPADIFSLGLILYYMLTGEKPFGDASQDMVRISRITGKSVNLPKSLDIPGALRNLYVRMTSSDANKRPNAEEVFVELKQIENELKAGTFSGSHSFNHIHGNGFFGSVYGKASIFLSFPLLLGLIWWFWSPAAPPNTITPPPSRERGTSQTQKQGSDTKVPTPPVKAPSPAPQPERPRPPAPVVVPDAGATPEKEPTPPRKTEPSETVTVKPPKSRRSRRRRKRKARDREYRIVSSPSGAKVYSLGKYLGKTPLLVKKPAGQAVTYLVKRGGFITYRLLIPANASNRTYSVRLREISIEIP